jgi:hypothetical protein
MIDVKSFISPPVDKEKLGLADLDRSHWSFLFDLSYLESLKDVSLLEEPQPLSKNAVTKDIDIKSFKDLSLFLFYINKKSSYIYY